MRSAAAAVARQAYPLAVAAAAFILVSGLPSADSDTYWHLASAKWAWDHGALLRHDVFSSTVAGHPYGIGEWLGELALYASYQAGGWAGIAILRAVLVGSAAFFLTRLARRSGAPPLVTLPLVVAVLAVSSITWTDRPQLWTLAFVPLLLDLLLAARGGRERALLVIPPLFLLWANLHGGYTLGVAILGAFGVEAVVLRRPGARRLALTAVAAGLLTFVNAAPFDAGLTAREDAIAPPRFISEFAPPDVLSPAGFIFALLVLGTLAAALARGGELLDALLLIPILWLALSAQRHMEFFAIVAAPFIAARAGAFVPPRLARLSLRAPAALGIAALLCVAAAGAAFSAPGGPDERAYPANALPALRAGTGRLLNEYDWGGYLIWRVPERPVFVDGRYVPYLGGVLDDFRAVIGLAPSWHEILARYDVRAVLLRPGRPLAVALREDGWIVRAEGPAFVLLERP